MVNEIIGLALLAVPFTVAIATVIKALADRNRKPEPLLGVVHPQKPQEPRRARKTVGKE